MTDAARRPTLHDVARLSGTSIATASAVLSETSTKYVSEQLQQRVLEAANRLRYRPNIAARRMKGKRGKLLAILIPQFENVFFNRVVIGAESYANSAGYILSIFSTYDREEKEITFIENLLSMQVDGILICPANNKSKSVNMIRKANVPLVVVDRLAEPATDYDFVAIDNYQAAYEGTRLLLNHGHRKILFVGWKSPLNTITDRVQGFRDAIRDFGADPEDSLVFESERDREAVYRFLLDSFKNHRFTAILAALHMLGEGVLQSIQTLNLKIPDDLSVLIYGNPTWASLHRPPLTCIAQPDLEVGRKAAELLIDQLENEAHEKTQIILRTELVTRQSVRYLERRTIR